METLAPRFHSSLFFPLVLALGLAACGGTTKQVRGVEAAGLPYRIIAKGGAQVEEPNFVASLRGADAVCLGETHSNPHDHWVQWHLTKAMTAGAIGPMAVGLEMFQVPFQAVLTDWQNKKISNKEMLSRSGWKKRWGFDFDLYRPVLERARERGLDVVALRISDEDKEAFKKATPEERSGGTFPEMDLENAQHRAWFEAQMGGMANHGGHGEDKDSAKQKAMLDRFYSVQVLWDESMAENAAAWLKAGEGRKMIIIAGKGHCHESAIVARLKRRGPFSVLSVFPVIDDGQGNVAALIAEKIHDYLFVMSPPSKAEPGAGASVALDAMRK